MIKFFCDCIKDATAQSVHAVTAIGNERKRRQTNRMMAADSRMTSMKEPNVSVAYDQDDDPAADIVRGRNFIMPFEVKKTQPDQQLVFGWASVVEKDGKLIIDKQGDMIPVEELENAAYEFVLFSRDQGDMHRNIGVGKMVESMVFTKEKQQALGINLGMVGWWVGFKVHDSDVWSAHKRGERLEFSIGGAAVPIEVTQKREGRKLARYPFDEGAARAMQLTATRLLVHQQNKLLSAYETRRDLSYIINSVVEDDNVLQYSIQQFRQNLSRVAQRTGVHAVENLFTNPDRSVRNEQPGLRHVYGSSVDAIDKWAREFAEERAHSLVGREVSKAGKRSIQDTTREISSDIVREAIDKGWSTKRLERALDKSGLFNPGRAEMIARTEISAAQNTAMLKAGYKFNEESKRKVHKIWLLGPRPCPICEENDGEEIELDEPFESGHFAPPVHPNCMCEVQLVY